jgi:soluble cytochrome b562
MKLHRFLATAFLALAFVTPAFAETETPLEKQMDKANKSLKAIERAAKAGTVGKDLAAKADEAKAAFQEAAKLEPAKAADVPAADKAKFVADYKASMEATIKTVDELKTAIDGGKVDEVLKVYAKLTGQKKEGHKAFKKED